MDEIASCITEYGMKLSERKSKVVCMNGTVQNRKWRCGETEIREVEEYQYLGVTVQGGKNGGFKSMGDRMACHYYYLICFSICITCTCDTCGCLTLDQGIRSHGVDTS